MRHSPNETMQVNDGTALAERPREEKSFVLQRSLPVIRLLSWLSRETVGRRQWEQLGSASFFFSCWGRRLRKEKRSPVGHPGSVWGDGRFGSWAKWGEGDGRGDSLGDDERVCWAWANSPSTIDERVCWAWAKWIK